MHTFEGHGYMGIHGIDNNWKVKIKPSPSPSFPLPLSPCISPVPSYCVVFFSRMQNQNAKSGVSQHPLHSPPAFGVLMF